MAFIYKITSPSGKIYIGSTYSIKKRKAEYMNLHCKRQPKILASLKKYTFEKHIFEVVKECSNEERFYFEHFFGEVYDVLGKNGLNCRLPKKTDTYKSISDEVRKAMSERQKKRVGVLNSCYGIKRPDFAKMASELNKYGENNPNYGNRWSAEQRENLRLQKLGKPAPAKMKIVLNTQTGIYYDNVKEAAFCHCIGYSTLCSWLNGSRPNNSNLTFA